MTALSKVCAPWTDIFPDSFKVWATFEPSKSANFCRNLAGDTKGPGCYVKHPTGYYIYEHCNIPYCSECLFIIYCTEIILKLYHYMDLPICTPHMPCVCDELLIFYTFYYEGCHLIVGYLQAIMVSYKLLLKCTKTHQIGLLNKR